MFQNRGGARTGGVNLLVQSYININAGLTKRLSTCASLGTCAVAQRLSKNEG